MFISGVLCQKKVSRAINYLPQYLWDVITAIGACFWHFSHHMPASYRNAWYLFQTCKPYHALLGLCWSSWSQVTTKHASGVDDWTWDSQPLLGAIYIESPLCFRRGCSSSAKMPCTYAIRRNKSAMSWIDYVRWEFPFEDIIEYACRRYKAIFLIITTWMSQI